MERVPLYQFRNRHPEIARLAERLHAEAVTEPETAGGGDAVLGGEVWERVLAEAVAEAELLADFTLRDTADKHIKNWVDIIRKVDKGKVEEVEKPGMLSWRVVLWAMEAVKLEGDKVVKELKVLYGLTDEQKRQLRKKQAAIHKMVEKVDMAIEMLDSDVDDFLEGFKGDGDGE